MKIKKIVLILLCANFSLNSSEIVFDHSLELIPQMSQNEIQSTIDKTNSNAKISISSGEYNLDKLELKNKDSIRFDVAKDVILNIDKIEIENSNNIAIRDLELNNKSQNESITIKNSKDIYLSNIDLESKNGKGVIINSSQNIFLNDLNINNIDKNYHIKSEHSNLEINDLNSNKKRDISSKPSIVINSSNISINGSDFSSEKAVILKAIESNIVINNSNFISNISSDSALEFVGDNRFKVANSLILNYKTAIHSQANQQAQILSNNIENSINGILVESTFDTLIDRNRFINSYDFAINSDKSTAISIDNSTADILSNSFTNYLYGIKSINSNIYTYGNRFDYHTNYINSFFLLALDSSNISTSNNITIPKKYNSSYSDKSSLINSVSNDIFMKKYEFEVPKLDFSNIQALLDAKMREVEDVSGKNTPRKVYISGELFEDIVINQDDTDLVLDSGTFIKIDAQQKKIIYPVEHQGVILKYLPKLKTTKKDFDFKVKVNPSGDINMLDIIATSRNSIKSIKYQGSRDISFRQTPNANREEFKYSFTVALMNSSKLKSFLFTMTDEVKYRVDFIVNGGEFRVVNSYKDLKI